jgi:DNA-binding NarL/FixJ family response regulator
MAAPAPLRVSIISPYPCIWAGLTALLQRAPERAVVVETPARLSDVGSLVDAGICDVAALRNAGADAAGLLADGVPMLVFARMGDGTARAVRHVGESRVVREDATSAQLLAAVERVAGRDPGDWRGTRPAREVLTPREVDVVRLIASGYSNEEIGRQLVVGSNSVKTYIRTAYKGMGVRSRTQAVLWAIRHGIVPAPQPDAEPEAVPQPLTVVREAGGA